MKLTRRQEIDTEVLRVANRLKDTMHPHTLPRAVYLEVVVLGNDNRKRPYRISFDRVQDLCRTVF